VGLEVGAGRGPARVGSEGIGASKSKARSAASKPAEHTRTLSGDDDSHTALEIAAAAVPQVNS
jgi:hypothetical protein